MVVTYPPQPTASETGNLEPLRNSNGSTPSTFWEYHSRRTVNRLALVPGAQVLDVYCGSGAAAVVAAQVVAPHGCVIAVDRSEQRLELAAQRAARAGTANIEWHAGSPDTLPFGDGSFDAVMSVFGIFLASDVRATVRKLWGLLRPGGQLAITTWAQHSFEPANAAFWEAIRRVRPSLFRAFNPWDRIDTVRAVGDLLRDAGIANAEIVVQPCQHPLRTADDWWTMVSAPGYRDVLDQLAPLERDLVEIMTMRPMLARGIAAVDVAAICASAKK
jgi:ubiquinone/menaquinone biosynthesis C-methylase UbiE